MIARILALLIVLGLSPTPAMGSPEKDYVDRSKCFSTGEMYVCANNVAESVYTVSVLAPTKSAYPATLLVTCKGKPEADAFGTMPPVMPSDFLEQFCAYIEGTPYLPDTEQFM